MYVVEGHKNNVQSSESFANMTAINARGVQYSANRELSAGERMHSRGELYSSAVDVVIGIIAIEMRAEDAMKN